jgi:hypothetical protein
MKLIEFPEQTVVIAKDQPQYLPMPAHVTHDDMGRIICCWKLNWRERLRLLLTGTLWHHICTFGKSVQPQLLDVKSPFVAATKVLIGSLLILVSMSARAQTSTNSTSPLQDIINLAADIGNGPWGVYSGYGHSISGPGASLVFAGVTYDLVTNASDAGFGSGAIVGYDDTFSQHAHQINSVNGGWQVSWTGKPLEFIGSTILTNITATVMAYQVIATPEKGNAVGAITGTSVSFDIGEWSGFHLKALGMYESRNGTAFDGNWLCGGLAIAHKF